MVVFLLPGLSVFVMIIMIMAFVIVSVLDFLDNCFIPDEVYCFLDFDVLGNVLGIDILLHLVDVN